MTWLVLVTTPTMLANSWLSCELLCINPSNSRPSVFWGINTRAELSDATLLVAARGCVRPWPWVSTCDVWRPIPNVGVASVFSEIEVDVLRMSLSRSGSIVPADELNLASTPFTRDMSAWRRGRDGGMDGWMDGCMDGWMPCTHESCRLDKRRDIVSDLRDNKSILSCTLSVRLITS
jgi:hypothetical protein